MDVLILSRNVAIYSTRRLVEAFRSRGRSSTVLDPAALCLRLGSGVLELFLADGPLPLPRVALPRIGAGAAEHPLAVLRHLEALRVPLTASAHAVAVAGDKLACLQILAAQGLPVPRTALARQSGDANRAIEAVGGPPVVLKLHTGTHGVGVFLAETRETAITILEAMWALEKSLLVQQFVASAVGTDLRLFVVGSHVAAAIRRTAPAGSFRSNLHHGGKAEKHRPDPDVEDLAIRAAAALGLDVAGVDILESDDGPLVCEVNASPGLEGIEDATGVDVAGAVADEALRMAARG